MTKFDIENIGRVIANLRDEDNIPDSDTLELAAQYLEDYLEEAKK
jgi:hypothetical protein